MVKTSRIRIASTIADHTLKQGVSKSYAKSIAGFLLSEHRTRELDSLLRDVQVDWAKSGHVEVVAYSAYSLTEEVRQDIIREIRKLYPEARKIILNEVYDESVIGGVRIVFPNQQLDLSVIGKLNKFKQLTTRKD